MRTYFRSAISLLVVFCVMFVSIPIAKAAVVEPLPVEPMYTGISGIKPSLTISSSGYASCVDTVKLRVGYSADVTWELQRSSKTANTWTTQMTWKDSGSGVLSLSKHQFVTSGYKYRLQASVDVYNSDGARVESSVVCSNIVIY